MLWPDALEHMRSTIDATLNAEGYSFPVYLGVSTAVPNNDGIYIIRGELTPDLNMCGRESVTAYVEIWAKATAPDTGDDDVEMENNHVIASWNKVAAVSHILSAMTFAAGNPGYTIDHERSEGDGGAFHPVAAERLTFKISYGAS